jgi:hypothetical protein
MQARELPDLHDAWFRGLRVDWRAGTATLRFEPVGDEGDPHVRITAHAIADLRIPHAEPWGPSAYVLRIDVEERAPMRELRVSMQSGDVVTVLCESFSVTFVPAESQEADEVS